MAKYKTGTYFGDSGFSYSDNFTKPPPSEVNELDEIFNALLPEDAALSSMFREIAKTALQELIAKEVKLGKIEELKGIQLEYGHYAATTYINDKPQGIRDRIKELEEKE